jgi:hypothetical protein
MKRFIEHISPFILYGLLAFIVIIPVFIILLKCTRRAEMILEGGKNSSLDMGI